MIVKSHMILTKVKKITIDLVVIYLNQLYFHYKIFENLS